MQGFGVFSALDFALALDVLQSSTNMGLDLGVWHQAEVLPRLLSTPMAGALLTAIDNSKGCNHVRNADNCIPPCQIGWQILWGVVALYFVVAAFCIVRVKSPRVGEAAITGN